MKSCLPTHAILSDCSPYHCDGSNSKHLWLSRGKSWAFAFDLVCNDCLGKYTNSILLCFGHYNHILNATRLAANHRQICTRDDGKVIQGHSKSQMHDGAHKLICFITIRHWKYPPPFAGENKTHASFVCTLQKWLRKIQNYSVTPLTFSEYRRNNWEYYSA